MPETDTAAEAGEMGNGAGLVVRNNLIRNSGVLLDGEAVSDTAVAWAGFP